MKDEEKWFFKQVVERCDNTGKNIDEVWTFPRDIINESNFPFHYKRAWYFLEKWARKGLYNYGTSLDLGWIEEKGKKIYETI